ncbi:unnamed protein product [Rotaria magnacalcarata]
MEYCRQNSLCTNILQNIRRLFRSDPCLKELFSTIVDEHCQCQQCDCTILNRLSPCLALTVNRLHINVNDSFIHTQGVTYDMIYIIEFDVTLRSILNVHQRQDIDFMIVDGNDMSSRRSTIDSHGKFLTLWMSRKSYQLDLTLDSDRLMPSQSTNSNTFDELESLSPATTASEGTSDDDTTTTLHNRPLEQLSSTRKSKRTKPYTTA